MADIDDLEIRFDADEASARQVGDALERAMLAALQGIGTKIAQEIGRAFKKTAGLGSLGDTMFEGVGRSSREAAGDARVQFSKIEADLEDLARQARASGAAFQKLGLPPDLARGMDVAARGIRETLEDLRRREAQFVSDPVLRKHFEEVAVTARRQFQSTSSAHNEMLNLISKNERSAADRQIAEVRKSTAEINAARGTSVAAMQQETTRIRAENRVQEAEIRSSAQRRNAIFAAATRQFFNLQRSFGRALALRTQLVKSSFAAVGHIIGGSTRQMGGLLRRHDRELGTGLAPALNRRETTIRESFRNQERIVQSSIVRQSAQINRFERTLSTGVLGAATGRSALGGLLGGGLAIGGGFAFANVLREGITAGADFVQGLAVLDAQLGLTDKQMANVRETALALGNDISLPGVSALDAAEAIQILSKQFAKLGPGAAAAAQQAAKGTLQLSRASGASAEEAGQLIGAAVNVFGIQADKAVGVADKITGALTQAAGVGFQDFASAFISGAGVFAQFQKPVLGAEGALVEFNTALAVLARSGSVGEEAGTGLRQFFLRAVSGSKPAVKALTEIADRAGVVGSVFFDQEGTARSLTDSLDIMRGGLKGMSQEQRTAALSTIFGSRAIRTVNALLKVSTPEYEKIRAAVRKQGLAAEIAAAQNTGLRGAMDALGSVIETQLILAYETVQGVGGNLIVHFADLANKVFSAEGAFAVFRDVAKGVALGLGSLLAIKIVAEGFSLLGVAVRGLLTPFGLIGLAFAALGTAFVLLSEHSPEFAAAVADIRESLGRLLGQGLKLAQRGLRNFVDLLDRTVIPALTDAAGWIGDNIGPAFKSVSNFITDEAIPALRNVARVIRTTVVPAAQAAFEWLSDRLAPAISFIGDTADALWRRIGPILTPIGKAFADLGEAVVNFFKGTVGFDSITGALGGVGSSIVDLGATILDGLAGVATNAFEFIRDFIDGINWVEVGFTVLDAIEDLGRLIGNILTNPQVLATTAAVAAALAAAAFRFVVGFAQAVRDNMVEFARIVGPVIGRALRFLVDEGWKFAFANQGLLAGIAAAAFVAIFAGSKLLTAFRSFGKKGATEIGKGLSSEMPRALGRTGQQGTFLQGLFGSPATVQRQIRAQTVKIGDQLRREISTLEASLKRGGISPSVILKPGASLQELQTMRNTLRTQFQDLGKQVGPARAAGLQLRGAFDAAVAQGRKTGSFVEGLRTFATGSQGALKQIGTSIGNSLAFGIGAAMTGFFAGKSGSSGLTFASIIGSGLAAFSATGSPQIGLITAAFAGIGAAFGANAAAAEQAKAEVKDYTDALLEAGKATPPELTFVTVLGEQLAEQSAGVRTFFLETTESFEALGRTINSPDFDADKTFGDMLASLTGVREEADIIRALAEDGLGFEDLTRVLSLPGVRERMDELGLSTNDVVDAFKSVTDESSEFRQGLKDLPSLQATRDEVQGTEEAVTLAKGAVDKFNEALGQAPELKLAAVREETEKLNTKLETAATRISEVFQKRSDVASEQLANLKTKADEARSAASDARDELEKLISGIFEETTKQKVDEIVIGLGSVTAPAAKDIFSQAQRDKIVTDFQGDIESAISTSTTEGLDKGLTDVQIEKKILRDLEPLGAAIGAMDIPPKLRERLLKQLEIGQGDLPEIVAEVKRVKNAEDVASIVENEYNKNKPDLEATIEVNAQLAAGITDLAELITNLPVGPARAALEAQLAKIAEGAGIDLSEVGIGMGNSVKEGVESVNFRPVGEGLVHDVATGIDSQSSSFRPIGEGLATKVNEGIGSIDFTTSGGGAAGQFASGITGANQIVATAGEDASKAAAVAMQIIAIVQAALAGTAAGTSFAAGITGQEGTAQSAGSGLGSSAVSGASGHSLFGTGVSMASGMAAGLAVGAVAVFAQAAAIAARVKAIIESALQISSPSRVTREMGVNVSLGLAQGISDGIRAAVRAAAGLAQSVSDIMDEILGDRLEIFDRVFRSDRPGNIGQKASFEGALDEMVKAMRDLKKSIEEQNKERKKKGLDPLPFDPSINPKTERGREGISLFTSIVDSAKDILASMVAAGKSTEEIKKRFKELRLDVIEAARKAGFSSKEITRMLERLDFTSGDFAKFIKQLKGSDREGAFDSFLDAFNPLIEGILDNLGKGRSNQDLLTLIVRNLREAGVSQDVIKLFRSDILKFIQEWRKDPSRKSSEQLEKLLKSLEPKQNPVLARFGDEISRFVEQNRGLGTDALTRQVVQMLRSVGIDVTGKDRDAIRNFVSHLRADRVDAFGRAIDKAARRLEAGENFVDRFSSQFDRIIEEFAGNPRRIRAEIDRALRAAGLGKAAKRYSQEINEYIRSILRDPGRRLDEYLERLLGEHEPPREVEESNTPVINVYPPTSDPYATALVVWNKFASSRPRNY